MFNGAYSLSSDEFIVNATRTGLQTDASVTALASGGFVLSWTDSSASGADTSGTAVRAQIYDSDGVKLGAEITVNSATLNAQNQSSVSALSSGGFVVTWTDGSGQGGDASGQSVKAQIYTAAGARIGGEFLVNSTTNQNQSSPVVTGLASGGFMVSWMDGSGLGPDAKGTGIRAQMYDPGGARIGGEFLLNSTIAGSQTYPSISGLASGGFVASWADGSGLGGDPSGSIKAQLFSASGAKIGGEVLVNSTTAGLQDQPVVTSLSSGGFAIAWRDTSLVGDTSGSGVRAQLFDATGSRVGNEIRVNTTTANSQDQPAITATPDGGFAVSWRDNSILAADASGFGIKAQMFDGAGSRVGSEFQVNGVTAGNQEAPAICALGSGKLVVGWSDASGLGGDADGSIKGRILSPTTGTITDLALSGSHVSETSPENTIVAGLTANGAGNASYSYTLIDDSTGGAFRIDGDKLEVRNSLLLDYETSQSATLTIRASDGFGNSFDKIVTLALDDVTVEARFAASDEVLVNSVIAGNQQQAAVTALANGNYLVTWSDASGISDPGNGIKARIFDSAGAAISGELPVNSQTLNSQDNPAVAARPDGGFVISWADASATGPDSSGYGVKAQIFDAAGAPVGGEFLVNSATDNAQRSPAVATLASGDFVVSWTDASLQGGDNSGTAIKAQLFGANGAKLGTEFLVNTATASTQDTPAVTALSSGDFVVTWRDSSLVGGDSSKDAVKAQIFDAGGGRIGGEFLVNTITAGNQQQETVTALASGVFVCAWADNSGAGGDGDYFGVKLQVFDGSGQRVGGEVLVNSSTTGGQMQPTISALQDGGFIVGWADYGGTGPETGTVGIKAQIFADSGAKVGGEFIVDAATIGSQTDPAIAGGDRGYAVAWTDTSAQLGDDAGTAVKLRVFTQLAAQGGPPPLIANADTVAATEDQAVVIAPATLTANDTDAWGLPISIVSVSSISCGTVALDADGNVVFTPAANFSGSALFSYIITDGIGIMAPARVTVTVAPVNDLPVARDDAVSVGQAGGGIAAQALLANDLDVDAGDRLSVASVSATSALGVALSLSNGTVSYLPDQRFQSLAAGETLADSFGYTVVDQAGAVSNASVTVTVIGTNDAPGSVTLGGGRIDENAANGSAVGSLAAIDPDHGDRLSYSLTNNAGGRFAVDAATGAITVANGALLDYEKATSHLITAHIVDSGGLAIDASFTIQLNNLPEPRSWTGDNGVNMFTAPTNDLWTIDGLGGNDVLTGNLSADRITGGAGNDTLDGSGGADTLAGGIGADIYYVDNAADKVIEAAGEGTDLVYSAIDFTLDPNIEQLTLTGMADLAAIGNDLANTITGNAGANSLRGGLGGDLLSGGDGNDLLLGEGASDFLQGGAGDDVLVGNVGADELTGGAGADRFVFDSLTASSDRDIIKDFVSGVDRMALSAATFAALGPTGALPAGAFAVGNQATTADQHLIYTAASGNLYYDADGVGGAAQIQIALLSGRPAIAASDLVII